MKKRKEEDCKKAGTIKAVELCFCELIGNYPKFRWVTMKDLYRCVKNKVGRLSIKQFQDLIREMWETDSWEDRRVDLSRASIARPHVGRYGIRYKNGVYYYVKVRKVE